MVCNGVALFSESCRILLFYVKKDTKNEPYEVECVEQWTLTLMGLAMMYGVIPGVIGRCQVFPPQSFND